jgi:NAD(P)-dependent dehydrogenase (short-subunit alcohol dehydrogenase family)
VNAPTDEDPTMIDFAGQAAIVTGAGRGLGRLYALELARRGAAVVVNDLGGTMGGDGADPSVADGVVAEIESTGGVAVASHDSVATPGGGEGIVRAALDRFDRLDAVVSNAGIFSSVGVGCSAYTSTAGSISASRPSAR